MRSEPSGPYNWILQTKDHLSRYITLWPLIDKHADHVGNALAYFIICFGPPDIFHSDNGGEFKGAILHLQQRIGIRIRYGGPRYP